MTTRIRHHTEGTAQTTDSGTAVTIASWAPGSHNPVINNVIVNVTGTLVGKSSINDGISITAVATFSIISGTVSLLGTQTSLVSAQGAAALLTSTITLDTSSNIIRLRANGIVALNITWTGFMEIKSTEF